MGHHGQVSPVPGAESRYAPRRAVRVQGVLFSWLTLVVKVTQRGQTARNNLVLGLGATKFHKTCGGEKKEGIAKPLLRAATDHRAEGGDLGSTRQPEATVGNAPIFPE